MQCHEANLKCTYLLDTVGTRTIFSVSVLLWFNQVLWMKEMKLLNSSIFKNRVTVVEKTFFLVEQVDKSLVTNFCSYEKNIVLHSCCTNHYIVTILSLYYAFLNLNCVYCFLSKNNLCMNFSLHYSVTGIAFLCNFPTNNT